MKKEYVLGFAFSRARDIVLLIEKQKPYWQKGKINGIGGKVEPNEKRYYAMIREFKEETGINTNITQWKIFAEMIFKDDIMGGEAIVHCFRMFNDDIFKAKTVEDEVVSLYSLDPDDSKYIWLSPTLKNLAVLIPMALDEDFENCTLNLL